MAGGLLNIYAVSAANVIIHGNPQKTFFKATYAKITNFGLQKFRIDHDGVRTLRLNAESVFSFKMKRYADLLMDTYICVSLPNIWSPIYHPCDNTGNKWAPYEFRWIDNIGAQIVKSVEITCGAFTLQKYSGEYILSAISRDMPKDKKELFDAMTGNVTELNDPANASGRVNTYPNAYYTSTTAGAEPSIRGRDLCIPITSWFSGDSRCAFPLIALQYNELTITVTLRPIQELFRVRDVFDSANDFPYIQPVMTENRFLMYRFLQSPPSVRIDADNFENTVITWNADPHLISTYCFLSSEEAQTFAAEDQVYLVKDVVEYSFANIAGSTRVRVPSAGLVASWMFHMRRSDANLRNEWSNYTNWPYSYLPANVSFGDRTSDAKYLITNNVGPYFQPAGNNTGILVTGEYSTINEKHILLTMGILLDGEYRENTMQRNVYDYIEKYARARSFAPEGQYCYNFCINSAATEYQPSGAINLSKFKTVELEIEVVTPTLSNSSSRIILCDDGTSSATYSDAASWSIYEYTFDLTVYEERYNVLSFVGGSCGLLYAR
jgi:hypothetical protein